MDNVVYIKVVAILSALLAMIREETRMASYACDQSISLRLHIHSVILCMSFLLKISILLLIKI